MTYIFMKVILMLLMLVMVFTTFVHVDQHEIMGRVGMIKMTFDDQGNGVVKYELNENGWKIAIPGKISGVIDDDKLMLQTNTVKQRYNGVEHELYITVDAKREGGGFIGTKTIYMDGESFVDSFEAVSG